MNNFSKYHFLHLFWLLPIYFFSMLGYQAMVYSGISQTYGQGASYVADVIDFDIKQIAAQSNGYVVLDFQTDEGEQIRERLALPVQMAQVLMDSERIPVRYDPASFRKVVIVSTFELQQNVVRVNMAVSLIGGLATAVVA